MLIGSVMQQMWELGTKITAFRNSVKKQSVHEIFEMWPCLFTCSFCSVRSHDALYYLFSCVLCLLQFLFVDFVWKTFYDSSKVVPLNTWWLLWNVQLLFSKENSVSLSMCVDPAVHCGCSDVCYVLPQVATSSLSCFSVVCCFLLQC